MREGADSWFFEEKGFAIWCHVRPEKDGTWTAWATFEALADFHAMKTFIKGARYRITQQFATRDEAATACSTMALERAREGDVQLGP